MFSRSFSSPRAALIDSDLKAHFIDFRKDGTPGSGKGKPPTDGNLYLDSTINWSADGLKSVVLHEIGHTLGLGHSTNPLSIMYPYSKSGPVVSGNLDSETIQALQGMYGWLPQQCLSDRASTDGPSLAYVVEPSLSGSGLTQVFMVWTGSEGDSSIYFSSSNDGLSWSPQQPISGVGSSIGPSLATFHPPSSDGDSRVGLIMAWKGVGDDSSIWWSVNTTLQVDGWAEQQRLDVGTSSRPSIVEFNHQIALAWKGAGNDSSIWWTKRGSNGQWEPQKQIAGRGTSCGPTLIFYAGQLHMFWKGIDGDSNVYHAVLIDELNEIWGPQEVVTFTDAGNLNSGESPVCIGTQSELSATVHGQEIVLAWRGIPGDDSLWFSRFNKNLPLEGQISIPNVGSAAGPSVTDVSGRLVLAWRGVGGDRNLWVSRL
ncbi:matrixin family metalloprotease [Dyella sp. OK004]|uniref:matrixin family metalloprotease n=1 Tax=Dyella sp. OK004 TaxID=1855292 RepID=UPI0015A5CC01|nr:matrixin family metalloprotease [Dyella sp. OK004]